MPAKKTGTTSKAKKANTAKNKAEEPKVAPTPEVAPEVQSEAPEPTPEVEAVVEPTTPESPEVPEAVELTPEPTPEPVDSTPTEASEVVDATNEDKLPAHLVAINTTMDAYLTKMDKMYPSTEPERVIQQTLFRNIIESVLNKDGAEFEEGMQWLIKTVREHRKSVFADNLVYRVFPLLKIGKDELKRFEVLVSLLTTAASLQNPRDIEGRIDLAIVFRYVKNPKHQERLQSYFKS